MMIRATTTKQLMTKASSSAFSSGAASHAFASEPSVLSSFLSLTVAIVHVRGATHQLHMSAKLLGARTVVQVTNIAAITDTAGPDRFILVLDG
jgi:hypothetical protein